MNSPSQEVKTGDNWERTLLLGILVTVSGLGITGLINTGRLSENVSSLNGQMSAVNLNVSKLADQLTILVTKDLRVLERRLDTIEAAGMLPKTEREIGHLRQSIAEINGKLRVSPEDVLAEVNALRSEIEKIHSDLKKIHN